MQGNLLRQESICVGSMLVYLRVYFPRVFEPSWRLFFERGCLNSVYSSDMWRLPKWVVRLAASKETKVQKDLCLKFRHGNWEHAGTYLWLFRRCVSQTPLKWLKTPSQGCCGQQVWQQVLEVCSTCTQRTPGRKHGIVTLPIWHFSWWFPGLSCTHLMDKNWHQLDIIEKKILLVFAVLH